MKKLALLLSLILIFASCGTPSKPEGMSDAQYKQSLELISKGKEGIKNAKEGEFPYISYLDVALYSQVLGDNKTAEENYKKILENDPNDYRGINNLASLYDETGEKEKALNGFITLMNLYPDNLEAIKDVVRTSKALKKEAEAEKTLKEFFEKNQNEFDEKMKTFVLEQINSL